MWSAVGLPISIQIGFENFKNMLKGARDIDNHFLSEDFNDNIPMLLACIGVWYNNFHHEVRVLSQLQILQILFSKDKL